jgi:hypothetical protein
VQTADGPVHVFEDGRVARFNEEDGSLVPLGDAAAEPSPQATGADSPPTEQEPASDGEQAGGGQPATPDRRSDLGTDSADQTDLVAQDTSEAPADADVGANAA